jgi:preprotein translocase subunit SecG
MGLYVLITVLTMIVAVLIVLVVLVQNSKGGGLASNFQGANYMGVRKTADFLEKATWSMAIAMLFFVLVSAKVIPKYEGKVQAIDSEIRGAIEDIPIPTTPFDPAENATQEPTGTEDDGDSNE